MWTHPDYKLLSMIRRLQAQVDFVSSAVGSGGGSGNAKQQVYEGLDDPTADIVIDKTIPALYNQWQSAGVPNIQWWWSVEDQTWY